MPDRQLNKSDILDDLSRRSRSFSLKATQLSNLLEQAEAFLVEMPGKVTVETEVGFDGTYLAFSKVAKGWRLLLYFNNEQNDWAAVLATQGTIPQKTKAAKHLPELYRRLIDYYDTIESEIEQGLNSLKDLPFLDFEAAQDSADQSQKGESDDIPF